MPKVPADEMRRQLGSLLGRAVEALGEVRDVVVRTSQVGKIKLDATFLRRERDRLFARLGEEVYDRVEGGVLEVPGELAGLIEQIRDVETRLEEQEQEIVAVQSEAMARRLAREEGRRQAEEVVDSIHEGKWEETDPGEPADEAPEGASAESDPEGENAVDTAPGDGVKAAPPSATTEPPRRKRGGRKAAAAAGGSDPDAGDEEP
jgi:hypothetical protein